VIPPSTRPVSPTASERSHASGSLSATLDASGTGAAPPDGIPAPIVDREEKLIRGYKNIPSLNAITERLRRTKLEAVQNVTNGGNTTTIVVSAPEAEPSVPVKEKEETEAPQAVTTETDSMDTTDTTDEHPLQHTW
jgi:hypothetical protein